jgi:hypothetical protein
MTVLALLSDAAPAAALAAGFEEEGVPLAIETARGSPAHLAREASKRSAVGIGVGGDADTLVLAVAGRPYLEAPTPEARAFGHAAARVVARRPLGVDSRQPQV